MSDSASSAQIRVHHVPLTRSFRVLWLCEELDLAYEVIPTDFSPEYRATPEWRALNPVGKVPVMYDGDIIMFESGAMVQHLLNRYADGRLEPKPGTAQHALYLQWSWFGESTFARPLGEIVNHKREFPNDKNIPAVLKEMADRARVSLDAVAQATTHQRHLLGEQFTAADIMVGYALRLCSIVTPQHMTAEIKPYWERLQARPAYQRALAI